MTATTTIKRKIPVARKRKGQPIHGWLVLDKPLGLTSTQALAKARRLFNAEKAGHGGTLDPLASGVLPIAFGEATKTVSFAMDGTKVYRFTVAWGEQRSTDDAEGEVIARSAVRPTREAILARLPAFEGFIQQIPPQFSALKVDGERAYDIAREGDFVDLEPRTVRIDRFELIDIPDADHATFDVTCGKGTYVRALARDLAEALGAVGHVSALRRLSVGRFTLDKAISLDELAAMDDNAALQDLLSPLATALDDIPALALTEAEAHRMRHGQSILLVSRQDRARLKGLGDGDAAGDMVFASLGETPVALARIDGAEVKPVRVLNV